MDEDRRQALLRRKALLERKRELESQKSGGIKEFAGKYVAPVGAGLLQGALDTSNFFGNLIPGALGLETIPKADVSQYLPEGYSKVGFGIGEYGPLLASLGALGPKAITAASQSKLGQRLGNALSSEKMGKTMLDKYKSVLQGSKADYANVFEEAAKAGAKPFELSIPKGDLKKLKKAIGEEALEKYTSNPSLEGAHYLRSALKKYERKIGKLGSQSHPSDRVLAEKAGQYSKKLKESLIKSLGEADPNLPGLYAKASANYKANVAPFRNVTGNYFEKAMLSPGEAGYIYPRRLPGKTLKQAGDPVRASLEKDIPELGIYEKIHSPATKLGGGGLGAYLGYKAFKKLV